MPALDDFQRCYLTETGLDLEALNFAVFEPLRKFVIWWNKQQAQEIKNFITVLLRSTRGVGENEKAIAGAALRMFLVNALGITPQRHLI
jgi:hypothetical protein